MAFYRATDLRSDGRRVASRAGYSDASQILVRRAIMVSDSDRFDIFLSHSYHDAATILGVAELFEAQDIRVYIDWIVDQQLDRSKVSAATAAVLRKRMGQCRSLVFATSTSSPSSKWMPWELGFFDGRHPGSSISIMPIEDHAPGSYGQEYLELYPTIQKLGRIGGGGGSFAGAVAPSGRTYKELREFASGTGAWHPLRT